MNWTPPGRIDLARRHRPSRRERLSGGAQDPRNEFGSSAGWPSRSAHTDETEAILNALDTGLCTIRVLFDASGAPVDYVFLEVNAAFETHTGLTDAVGRSMRTLRPDHEEHWFRIYGEIARSGEAKRFVAEAKALGRWYEVHAFRVGLPGEDKVAVLFSDITRERQQQAHVDLLTREIEHRARNTVALVSSLLRLTDGTDVAAYKAALQGRLDALLRSDLALKRNDGGSAYAGLVADETLPYQIDGRITFTGPPVYVAEPSAGCLAMVLHELATNAVKFGALSVASGRVAITWSATQDTLRSVWQESGGPQVTAPTRQGLGTTVIRHCVTERLGGRLSLDWQPSGLRVEFEIPLAGSQLAH